MEAAASADGLVLAGVGYYTSYNNGLWVSELEGGNGGVKLGGDGRQQPSALRIERIQQRAVAHKQYAYSERGERGGPGRQQSG